MNGEWKHKEIDKILRQEGRPWVIRPRELDMLYLIERWKAQDAFIVEHGGGDATNATELKAALGPDHAVMPFVPFVKDDGETESKKVKKPTIAEMKKDCKKWKIPLTGRRTWEAIHEVWEPAKLAREQEAVGEDEGDQSPKTLPKIKPGTKRRRYDDGEERTRKSTKENQNTTHEVPVVEAERQPRSPQHDEDIVMHEHPAVERPSQMQSPDPDVDTEMRDNYADERPVQPQSPEQEPENVASEVEAHESEDDTGSPPHKYGKRLYGPTAMGKTDYYPMEPHPLEATIPDHEMDWAGQKARTLLRVKAEREEAKAKGEPYVPKKVQQPKRKRPTLEDFQNRTKRFDRDGKLLVEMKGGKIIRRLDPGE
jgi:hypothetical protein